jgi:CRP/FNR family transcriptional regulator, cyclic AMP receptor protein
MDAERRALLRATPFFGAVSDAAIDAVVALAKPVERAPGEAFFREGERGTAAYLLESGRVAVWKRLGERDHLLRELARGDCFGEVALLDFGARSATISAIDACRALEISASALRQLAETATKDFAILYMNLGRELARRLRKADDRLFRAYVDRAAAGRGWEPGAT